MPAGGTLTITSGVTGERVELTVSDTGVGIPPEMLDAVFERFWQRGKNDRRGLGLGLYISNCIVEAHGGRMWVESTVGVGSTFSVAIPAAAAT
jgi:signal transduction histidine kinase